MTDLDRSVAEMGLGDFAQALASGDPVPGGGAAAGVAGALGASLTAMVVRLSLGRPKYAEHAALHQEALEASDAARVRFLELAEADAAAYAAYRAARDLPRETEAEQEARAAATRDAARKATQVPLDTVKACHAQVELVDRCVGRTNLYVASDLEVAALLLDSAARSAAVNVRANLGSIGDEGFADAVTAELDQRLQQIQSTADRTRERIAKGGLRHPEGE
jgi:glutamate formiminotransferase/formiminotetrahydrofolate cyclodeaminase